MMTTKDAYEITVNRIADIDKEIAELRGKRDAYNEMRAVLFEINRQAEESEGE